MKIPSAMLGLATLTFLACSQGDEDADDASTEEALVGPSEGQEGLRDGTFANESHALRVGRAASGARVAQLRLTVRTYGGAETVSLEKRLDDDGRSVAFEGKGCTARLQVGPTPAVIAYCGRASSTAEIRETLRPVDLRTLVGVYGDVANSEVATLHEASDDGVRFTLRSRGEAATFRAPWSGPLEVRGSSGGCTVKLSWAAGALRVSDAVGTCPAVASSVEPLPRSSG